MVYIIDTNVLAIANDYDHKTGLDCVENCIDFLINARDKTFAVDNLDRIFAEYRKYASLSGKPNVGDAFLTWLWNNRADERICIQVPIVDSYDERIRFEEIPQDGNLSNFDLSDQKFLAVAMHHTNNVTIVNASDSDWSEHNLEITSNGIRIMQLCPWLFDNI